MEGTFWLKQWYWRTVLENSILPRCAKSWKFKILDNFTKSDVFCRIFLLLQKGEQCCFMLCIIVSGGFCHFGGISSLLLFTEKVLNPFFGFFVFFGFHFHFFLHWLFSFDQHERSFRFCFGLYPVFSLKKKRMFLKRGSTSLNWHSCDFLRLQCDKI